MNVDLLRKVRRDILANPGDWNQGKWSRCFAGRTVRLSGGVVSDDLPGGDMLLNDCRLPGGDLELIKTAAERLLDIDADDTFTLFLEMGTDHYSLVHVVGELTGDTTPHPYTADTFNFPGTTDLACATCGASPDALLHATT